MKLFRNILLAVLAFGVILALWHNRPAAKLRRQLNYWVHQRDWRVAGMSLDEQEAAQRAALISFGKAGVDLLREDLKRHDDFTDSARLAMIQAAHRLSLPWLQRKLAFQQNSFSWRLEAARALALLGGEAKAAVPDLLLALNDTSGAAAEALGNIGVASPEVIQALRGLTSDPYPGTVLMANFSLWRLEATNSAAVKRINQLLASRDALETFSLSTAAQALGRIGSQARPFMPGLVEAMKVSSLSQFYDELQKPAVALAIWKIAGSAEPAVDYLAYYTNFFQTNGMAAAMSLESKVVEMTIQLGEIPEFGRAVRPLLLSFQARSVEPQLLSNALARVERTLQRTATNNPSQFK